MQSFIGAARSARTRCSDFSSVRAGLGFGGSGNGGLRSGFPAPCCVRNGSGSSLFRVLASSFYSVAAEGSGVSHTPQATGTQLPLLSPQIKNVGTNLPQSASSLASFCQRSMSTISGHESDPAVPISSRIKFKRLDKTARNIMQILDKEAVEEVKAQREVPDIKPGYIIQMKVVSPENKRRVTTIKGIVIARRNAGLNSTFRLRRLVAGVGVESLFPLYSPNIKEVVVLDKKKVRRAKLYYLRDRMNPLKNK